MTLPWLRVVVEELGEEEEKVVGILGKNELEFWKKKGIKYTRQSI